MATVIIISGFPGTGDPFPSMTQLQQAVEQLRQLVLVQELERARLESKAEEREPIAHDWPRAGSLVVRVLIGRCWPGLVPVVCCRYPSGFY